MVPARFIDYVSEASIRLSKVAAKSITIKRDGFKVTASRRNGKEYIRAGDYACQVTDGNIAWMLGTRRNAVCTVFLYLEDRVELPSYLRYRVAESMTLCLGDIDGFYRAFVTEQIVMSHFVISELVDI